MDFQSKLVHELTQMDIRQSTKRGHNPYALGIYMRAADECAAMVKTGVCQETAFTEFFTPSREMHAVARKLGFRLDVDRGQWFIPQE